MKLSEIENKAKKIFQLHNIPLGKLEVVNGNNQYNAYYDHTDDKIKINPNNMLLAATHTVTNPLIYTEMVVCHELGHMVDSESKKIFSKYLQTCKDLDAYSRASVSSLNKNDIEKYGELLKQLEELEVTIETNAWTNGKRFVSENLASQFDDFNRLNLQTYKNRRESHKKRLETVKMLKGLGLQ